MDQVREQLDKEFIYNIKLLKEDRIKLFLGENGKIIQQSNNRYLYSGGFMGNQFNSRLGKFRTKLAFQYSDQKLEYEGTVNTNSLPLARMGHLAFYEQGLENIVLFGGQKSGDKFKQTS